MKTDMRFVSGVYGKGGINMRLEHITGKKVEEYLKKSQTVLIPVGSIENHGQHMPLGTDTLIPNKIVELLEEKCGVMIAPTVPYGATDNIYGFPGTITIGTDGLVMLLERITDCLYRYGFRRFIILNGHGGNAKAIEIVGMNLHKRGAWLANLNWWLMAGELNPDWKGGHGGAEETAGVMGVNPDLIDMEYIHEPMKLVNDVSEIMPTTGWNTVEYRGATVVFPREYKNYSQNGWYGTDEPHLATKEWGDKMLRAMADYIVEFVKDYETVPLPEVH